VPRHSLCVIPIKADLELDVTSSWKEADYASRQRKMLLPSRLRGYLTVCRAEDINALEWAGEILHSCQLPR